MSSRWAGHRRDDGATAVEFAIVLPVVIVTVFFALYGALFFYYSAVADHVARSVARQVSLPVAQTGSGYPDANSGTVLSDARADAGGLIPAPTSAVATSSGATSTPQEGDLVTVTVTYQLPVLSQLASVVPGLSAISTITRSATERRQ